MISDPENTEQDLEQEGMKKAGQTGKLLCMQKASLAVAESCTGGLISNWITNVPGSSDYFSSACVTYSNKSKTILLGVLSETIKNYGAVHEKTAKEMAQGMRKIAGTTYGLSTTGIAGPTGATKGKPVGMVCIGIAAPDSVKEYTFIFPGNNRLTNKKKFAVKALDLLIMEIQKNSG
jgi:nicotinamide-nucleotide amidase